MEYRLQSIYNHMVGETASVISPFYSKRVEYILEWNLENSSVWILSVPFGLKASSKCTIHVNVHKLYGVEYINIVWSLDYPFQFRIFS